MPNTIPFSKVAKINRKADIINVCTDTKHVCFYKLFPLCRAEESTQEEDYRRFHLRFYFPKEKFIDKDSKVQRLILMFNGLDEINDCMLYDQLGYSFATRGIVSALLPLPDHFNRHPIFRYETPTKEQELKPMDTMKENPIEMYTKYIQFMGEIDLLLDHLHGQTRCDDDHCHFFRKFFNSNTRVSCLGYSLGGLAALASFLANKNRYNACFTLSSGIRLDDMAPVRQKDRRRWRDFLSKLNEQFAKVKKEENGKRYHDYFDRIFLGGQTILLQEELKEHSKRVLFIFGGGDSLIRFNEFDKIEDKDYGLAVFKIPGIDHLVAKNNEWGKWSDFTVNLIAQYEENAAHEYLTQKELADRFLTLDQKYKLAEKKDPFDFSGIPDGNDREELRSIQYAIMGYFEKNEEFVDFATGKKTKEG